MPVKITLEDDREFQVGQEVEWNLQNELGWVRRYVGLSISIQQIYSNPHCIRAIAPKVKRQMTAKEVWSLLQTGVEWRVDADSYIYIGGLVIHEDHLDEVTLVNVNANRCTYRTAPDQPWQKFEVEE